MVFVMPDAEAVIRAWVRTLTLPERARPYFGVPKDPKFPLVVIRRIGGNPDPDVSADYALVSFDVWHDGNIGGKAETYAVAATLAAEVNQCGQVVVEVEQGSGVWARITGATVVLGPVWRPDVDAHRPRYIVDASFTLTPCDPPADPEDTP